MATQRDCQLYLLSPTHIPDVQTFAAQLEQALAASETTATGERRVGAFQLRLERAGEDEWRDAVLALQPICARYETPLILNDHLDLALELDTDGVHLTENGMAVKAARQKLGEGRIIGKTCGASRDAAMKAGEAGADYVLFTSFYLPETNAPAGVARPDLLAWWQEFFVLPCVAAGGITPENCRPLVLAGADFVMALRSVWQHPQGAAAAVTAFEVAITEALQNL
jgi:thiamine-phosphate pyrophosphorylase